MSHRPIAVLLVLAGCGRSPQPAVEGGAAALDVADTTAEGTVRVVGPVETAQVVLRGATASVALTGPLAGELRRLAGARVRLTGTPGANATFMPRRAVAVREYQILEVDGQPALVGMILSRDGRLWLAGRDTVELLGAAPDLAARAGAKVFVLGVRQGERLQVKSYGVIREPR